MFEESLVESAAVLRSHNRWPAIVSITAQIAVAAALLLLPLFHPEGLPLRVPPLSLLAPPPPRPPVPPPPRVHVEPSAASAPSAPASSPAAPPASEPRILTPPTSPVGDAPIAATLNLNSPGNGLPLSLANGADASPRVVLATPAAKPGRIRISSGVSAGLLLAPIRPNYPAIAKASRTQGTVVVQAIISRAGRIEAAHVLSGPIMLQGAAIEAVRNARYRPFLLNDQPTEVETTITITFRLDN